jgi:uncharacterized protein YjdB
LNRFVLGAILLSSAVLPFTGCGSAEVDSIQISPASQVLAAGQTVQFSATGSYGHGTHPSSTKDVTSLVTWSSSSPAVATVSSTGLATGVAAGTTTITASMQGFTGLVSSSATVEVTGSSGTGGGDVVSLSVIPGTQSVASPGQTSQFLAIGTTSSGATENLTSLVAWSSSSQQIATVGASTGLATAVGQGTATITAIYTNVSDKTVATGTASFEVIGGNAADVTALTMYPGSQSATSQAQHSQFFVLGTEGNLQFDVSAQVVWTSSNTSVATVGTAGNGTPGLATAVGAGTTTITATFTNQDGSKVVATGSYSVSIGAAQEPLLSINIVPGNVTVSNKGMTGQYLAFGTYSTTPTVRDITNEVTWISLAPEVVSINSGGTTGEVGGLATAMGYTGNGVIYAVGPPSSSPDGNPDGTVVLSNSQTFTCKDPTTNVCDQDVAHPQFATLTFYNAGENTTSWVVTDLVPSTQVGNLIHCGPGWTGSGGSVCTGTYETGTTVVLTASPSSPASAFGGWSSGDGAAGVGCVPDNGFTLLNSPHCTITLTGNTSVGAIFY